MGSKSSKSAKYDLNDTEGGESWQDFSISLGQGFADQYKTAIQDSDGPHYERRILENFSEPGKKNKSPKKDSEPDSNKKVDHEEQNSPLQE